jgi:hypothetical protein
MKKIMFNDRYGLTVAVLQGRKTMTRRIVPAQYVPMIKDGLQGAALIEAQRHGDAYRENEIVAVAQSYETLANSGYLDKMVVPANNPVKCEFKKEYCNPGWLNKMFVRADLMPHQIQITDINIERLQDISDEDCLKEGIIQSVDGVNMFTFDGWIKKGYQQYSYTTPRKAFASLIDRISGKGTWQSNPFVVAYSFKLIK